MNNKKLFISNIGDLAEAQRASYYSLLSVGMSEEISHLQNPFVTNVLISTKNRQPCLVYLYPNEIKLKGPNASIEFCLKNDASYTIQVYIPCEYSYPLEPKNNDSVEFLSSKFSKKEKIQKTRVKQDIFFGEFPFMTEEGTFLISGCERIVISQIIRSPGIYFRKEFGSSKQTIYSATLISNKGLWTRFVYDTCIEPKTDVLRNRLYMRLNDLKRKG